MQAVEHVGKRIRLFRKQKNMTIDDLSSKLHLSPSTISKYENGKIAMDLETLFYIASVLDVSVDRLIDYNEPVEKKLQEEFSDNFFKSSNIFYLYRYYGMERRLGIDVLEITHLPEQHHDKVMIYRNCVSEDRYSKCSKLYQGRIYYSNASAHIVANSITDMSDFISMVFLTSSSDITTGILTGYSDIFNKPFSAKILASINPIEHDKELKELVKVNDKKSVAQLKEVNAFFVE